jgi:hypothetical protein
VRNTLAPTQDSGVSDDPDDFEPGQSHPQPDLDLTEDNRILCTQNTDRDWSFASRALTSTVPPNLHGLPTGFLKTTTLATFSSSLINQPCPGLWRLAPDAYGPGNTMHECMELYREERNHLLRPQYSIVGLFQSIW